MGKKLLDIMSDKIRFKHYSIKQSKVILAGLKDQNIQELRAKERKHIPVVLTIE